MVHENIGHGKKSSFFLSSQKKKNITEYPSKLGEQSLQNSVHITMRKITFSVRSNFWKKSDRQFRTL